MGARPIAAMIHPRNHEEPIEASSALAAHFVHYLVVVVDRDLGGDHVICPAMIHDQLAAQRQVPGSNSQRRGSSINPSAPPQALCTASDRICNFGMGNAPLSVRCSA